MANTRSVEFSRLAVRRLTQALEKAVNEDQLSKIADLDRQIRKMLKALAVQPKLRAQLKTELMQLKRQHDAAMAHCEESKQKLKVLLDNMQESRDGILAYQQAGAEIL